MHKKHRDDSIGTRDKGDYLSIRTLSSSKLQQIDLCGLCTSALWIVQFYLLWHEDACVFSNSNSTKNRIRVTSLLHFIPDFSERVSQNLPYSTFACCSAEIGFLFKSPPTERRWWVNGCSALLWKYLKKDKMRDHKRQSVKECTNPCKLCINAPGDLHKCYFRYWKVGKQHLSAFTLLDTHEWVRRTMFKTWKQQESNGIQP